MKIRKTAEQKNVILNTLYYTLEEIKEMEKNHEIKNLFPKDETDNYRIFTDDLETIKVICKDGFYTTVGIGKNGKKYYINL